MTRLTGGVMLYSLTVLIPANAAAYQLNVGDQKFTRHRRWSSFNELKEKVEIVLKKHNYKLDSEWYYLNCWCPPKARLWKNNATVASKRCLALGKFIQCLLCHEHKHVVQCTKDWLSLPDDNEGRTRDPTKEEEFNYQLMLVSVHIHMYMTYLLIHTFMYYCFLCWEYSTLIFFLPAGRSNT